MFQSAILKLTLWYMAIIIGLCLIFSFLLYHVSSREISTGLNNQVHRIEIDFSGNIIKRHPSVSLSATNQEISERSHHLLIDLFYFNLVAGMIAGFGSYALAKKTLRPLEAAHEQQARFTSDVSHELRTPLSVIKTETEVALLDKAMSTNELRLQLNSNIQEVNRMEGLINNLLRISKLEKQDLQKSFIKVNLEDVIKDSANNNKQLLKSKNIKLNLNTAPVCTLGNKENLIQIINILLDNAIKYSEKDQTIDINLKKRKFNTLIEIKDNGIGIEAKDMPFIFDRFYRAEQSRTKDTNDSGYGLGLPLAKFLVELHKGSINVNSNPKKGTRVSIVLPIEK